MQSKLCERIVNGDARNLAIHLPACDLKPGNQATNMWNKKKTIFLSYRRDDIPGYVRQLQEDLQRYFGEDTVFRDVEDIAGGQHWREVLANNLAQSAALIVVFGPRWEQIWNEREDKSNDFIVYELNKARELGVTIIPVTINGTVFSKDLDLGPIQWLMEKQQYDISDKQGRWPTDVVGLVDILALEKNLVRRKQKTGKSFKKLLLIPLIIAVFAVIGYLGDQESEHLYTADLKQDRPIGAMPIESSISAATQNPDITSGVAQLLQQQPERAIPNIAGYWHDDEGSVFEVTDTANGYFVVSQVDDIGDGTYVPDDFGLVGIGQFIPDMPSKFNLFVEDYGQGEYSVSANNSQMIGWFHINETGETLYGSLWRIDGAQ